MFGPLRTKKPPDVDFASLSPAWSASAYRAIEVKILRIILYDSCQPVVRRRVDVRDKTGEFPIVVARPLLHGGG